MPDEPTPISDVDPRHSEPEGPTPFSKLQGFFTVRKLFGFAIAGVLLVMLWQGSKPEGPKQLTVPKPAEQLGWKEPPAARTAQNAGVTEPGHQTPPLIVEEGHMGMTGQDTAKTIRDQLAEQRRQYEIQAAFAQNVVQGGQTKAAVIPPIAPEQKQPEPQPQITPTSSKPADTLAFNPNQQLYMLPEGTILEGILDSEVRGQMSGPVDAHVTANVYAPGTRTLLLPQGAKMLGTAERVTSIDQSRLAVIFHRALVYPPVAIATEPYSIQLDKQPGLDNMGAAGITGKVNNHMMSLLGAAAVIGLIQGASVATYSSGSNNISIGMMNGLSQSTSEVTSRILERFLNRLPTITIPAGTRIKFELIQDLQIPAYPEGKTL